MEGSIQNGSTDESSQIKELNQQDYDQILLQKQVDDQSRYVKILKQQNAELTDELEVMTKTDDLIRERLNRKE